MVVIPPKTVQQGSAQIANGCGSLLAVNLTDGGKMSTRPYHVDGSYSGLHQSVVSIADRSILDETSFRRMLSLEMKRALRSQKPFLLCLFEMETPLGLEKTRDTLRKILPILDSNTRDTDVTGWYKEEGVLAVMFTEISIADQSSIVAAIMSRMSARLRGHLTSQQFAQLLISFQILPAQESPKKTVPTASASPLYVESVRADELAELGLEPQSPLVPVGPSTLTPQHAR